MSILAGDPLTQLTFSVYENKGVFALLLGSGLSRAAGIPTGWEITLDLIRRVATARGVEEQPDWHAWYRQETGQEPNYSELLKELAPSPDERRSILHSYIEPTEGEREEGRKLPTAAHKTIAGLVHSGYIRVIITTNFDRLLENALREQGIEPTVVASPDALRGAEPITHTTCYILKLHGDYKDARILNTNDELSAYPLEYDALLDRIFDEYGLIICGWSGEWDRALKAALERAPNRRYPIYWAARGDLTDSAKGLVNHRDARVIPIEDADSFFSGLRERVQVLERSHRQNPLSVELLVNTTKRYLRSPEYRIQLNDLFAEETERLIARIDSAKLGLSDRLGEREFVEEFRRRVSFYEGITEPLACMAGVLGRWGDDAHLSIVLDILERIHAHANIRPSGQHFVPELFYLRFYPAVLIFTAYGIGLTRAERWATLYRFFSWEIFEQQSGKTYRVVEKLFLKIWIATPRSPHLFDIFSEWERSFIGILPDFDLLYRRFEILASLAHLKDEPETMRQLDGSGYFNLSIPVGRNAWNHSVRERLIEELQSDPMRKDLLKAGFANSNKDLFELFFQNFNRIADWARHQLGE